MAKYKVNENDPDTYVISKLNSKKYTRITHTHTTRWGLSLDEYMKNFNISKNEMISKQLQNTLAFTKDRAIEIYGDEIGNKKWDEYRKQQAYTNTFEYKNKKYGMTEEEFSAYNKNRSVTLENLINRHGDKIGRDKWDQYREKQTHAGCSLDYFIEKYGEDVGNEFYKNLNKQKSNTLENFVKRHGVVEGEKRYQSWMGDRSIGMSMIAQKLFDSISPYFTDNRVYYNDGDTKKEFGIYDSENKRCYYYDYIDFTLKKGIEFNGDVFHGNPKIFGKNDTPNFYNRGMICEQMWEYDRIKIEKIGKMHGIKIMTVWESDYKKDPELKLEECLNFLKND